MAMSAKPDEARRSIGARRNLESAEAIIEAAEAVLTEAGPAGFSIEAVARRARAGKPTIYRWWPSKAALLLDVYHRQKRFNPPDTGNIDDDLVEYMKGHFALWRDTPSGSIFRSIVAEAQSDEEAGRALAEYAAGRRVYSGKMIERAQARGEVRADVDPAMVADILSSYTWTHLLTGRLDESDDKLRGVVRTILDGIRVGRK